MNVFFSSYLELWRNKRQLLWRVETGILNDGGQPVSRPQSVVTFSSSRSRKLMNGRKDGAREGKEEYSNWRLSRAPQSESLRQMCMRVWELRLVCPCSACFYHPAARFCCRSTSVHVLKTEGVKRWLKTKVMPTEGLCHYINLLLILFILDITIKWPKPMAVSTSHWTEQCVKWRQEIIIVTRVWSRHWLWQLWLLMVGCKCNFFNLE